MLSFKNGPNDCMSSKTISVAVFLGVTMKHNVQTSITKKDFAQFSGVRC